LEAANIMSAWHDFQFNTAWVLAHAVLCACSNLSGSQAGAKKQPAGFCQTGMAVVYTPCVIPYRLPLQAKAKVPPYGSFRC
jgi:hypothetical protein